MWISESRLRRIALGAIVILLSGCTSVPARTGSLQIEGLVIENHTQMFVSAVRLLVPVNGNFVSCGNISPASRCATTFPERDYTGNPVEITWSQAGQIYSTGVFNIDLASDLDMNRPAIVVVVISAPGAAGALVVQRPKEGVVSGNP